MPPSCLHNNNIIMDHVGGAESSKCMQMTVQASVLLLSAFLACNLPTLEAAQCMPDETNPCVARCNGTTFDISNLFDYP